jgi:hypothetical protein
MRGVGRLTRAGGALLAGSLAWLALGVVAAPAVQAQPFGQCPPVNADKSCQYLITITDAGQSVTSDPAQGPYDGEDDSLVGVQNSSSKAIAALPLSSSTNLFGFEQDGLCDPGAAPVAPGCVPVPGSPAGTICAAKSVACSFSPPAGEPANTTEAGAEGAMPWPNGDRQNGYEGPTSWFTAINTGATSGTVNFSPAIQPGGSTYFSLESPPNAAGLMVGAPTPGAPTGPTGPPTAFGRNGIIQGLPSNKVCLSKRHFRIHIRRYPGITYVEAIVFINHHTASVTRSRSGQFSAPIDLRGLPSGTFPVKITVITTTGSIISGTRTYKTCHKKVGFHGPGKL